MKYLIVYLFILSLVSSCTIKAKTNHLKNEKSKIECEIIEPNKQAKELYPEAFENIKLLPHLTKQKGILKKLSIPSDTILQPDWKYLFGRFDCGVIEMEITKVDGEPATIYGNVNELETELEFLVYGIPSAQLSEIDQVGKRKVYWVETICLMEPFDDGFQRRFVAYKFERVGR